MLNFRIGIYAALILLLNQSPSWSTENSPAVKEGIELFNAGNYIGAVDKLNAALHSGANDEQTYIALGKSYFNLHRLEESRNAFEEALKINNKSASAILGISTIEAASGRCDKALSTLEKYEGKIPAYEKRTLYLIQLNCDQNDKYKNIVRLKELISLEGEKASIKEQLYLWQLYCQTDQPYMALKIISKILSISDTEENREKYGTTLFDCGLLDESIKVFKELIAKKPNDPQYHAQLAEVLTARESYDEARKEIILALSIDPSNPYFNYKKSVIERLSKEYNQCVISAQNALNNGNADMKAEALLNMSECLYQQGKIKETLNKYDRIVKECPNSVEAVFANKAARSIRSHGSNEDQYLIETIPFIRIKNHSSLSTAIKMLLKGWDKSNDLTENEIDAIEFDGRQPSLADALLLLKAKGVDSIIIPNNTEMMSAILKSGQQPILMRRGDTNRYLVITGFDNKKQTIYFNDPKMYYGSSQISYSDIQDKDTFVIIMPTEARERFVKEEPLVSMYKNTVGEILKGIDGEEDVFRLAKNIYRLNSKVLETNLILAKLSFLRKEYKEANSYYNDILKTDNLSSKDKGLILVKVAILYNLSGNMRAAAKSLEQSKQIDPENEHLYDYILKLIAAEKYFDDRKYKEAISNYKISLGIDETKDYSLIKIAVSYYMLGDIPNSEKYLNKAIELNSESRNIYLKLLDKINIQR